MSRNGAVPSRRPLSAPLLGAILVGIVSLVLYISTMSPTFGYVDKGEMAAVASTFGIPHPTGYPTLIALGYLWTALVPMRDVAALNLLAALLTAGGAALLALLLYDILGRLRPGRREDAGSSAPSETARSVVSASAALFIAATATWWEQGTGFEVYSLHLLMIPLVILLCLRYVDEEEGSTAEPGIRPTTRGFLFSLAVGLSFTNHLATILLAPALLVYTFARLGLNRRTVVRLIPLMPGFFLGLLPYALLPLRAAASPRFNWGDPVTFERFVDHVTGSAFRGLLFSTGSETFTSHLGYFLAKLPAELGYLGIPVALVGIVRTFRAPSLAVAALLLFLTCVVIASGYGIADIDAYYLTAFVALALWSAAGLFLLAERFGTATVSVCGLLLLACALWFNHGRADKGEETQVEETAWNMLSSLPPNAIVISSQFNYWLGGSWYLQGAEGVRPDVTVIYENLLGLSWFAERLRVEYPDIVLPTNGEIERFTEAARRYEEGEISSDPGRLQTLYLEMVNAIIGLNIPRRPIFVTGDIPPQMGANYRRVPNYLALRLMPTEEYLPQPFPDYRFRRWEGPADPYVANLHELYGRSLYARGLYEQGYGRDSLAMAYFRYALEFDPGFDTTDLPPIPLDGESQVRATARFFGSLRRGLGSR